jgi:CheY-like chemotaxis protein
MNSRPAILVVDDDLPILLLMQRLLHEFGFEAITARSGAEALSAVRATAPDLVLLDKNMPGMDGSDVIRALRGEPSLAQIPILILSGDPISPGELAELGADGAVQKPFDVPALVQEIRSRVATQTV